MNIARTRDTRYMVRKHYILHMSPALNELASGPVWAPYGLSGNPFFTAALVSQANVDQGIHLFRGEAREKDADKIVNRILNSENSVKLIEGQSGIGKTTLANFVKSKLIRHEDVAVYRDSVLVHPGQTTPQRFAAELLYATLLAIRNSAHGAEATRDVEAEARGRVLDDLVMLKERTGGLQQVLGVSWTRSQILKEARERPFGDWRDALVNVQLIAAAQGITRIVIHIDNLDQATINDADAVGELFGDIRDLLQIPGYHFILCGNEAFRLRALANRPGVLDIIGTPIRPSSLSSQEVEEIVQARYEDMRAQDTDLIPPIEPAEVAKVFEVFDGEIRLMFETLGQTFMEEIGPTGQPTQLRAEQVLEIQRPILSELVDLFSEPQYRIIVGVSALAGAKNEWVRQKELVDHLEDMNQAYVSQLAEDLVDAKWLVKHHPNQRATFYKLSGKARIVRPGLGQGEAP